MTATHLFTATEPNPLRRAGALVGRLLGWQATASRDDDGPQRHLSSWVILLCAAGLPLAAAAANASRLDQAWAVDGFYAAIALVFLPAAAAILWPATTRLGRIEAVALLTLGLYLIRLIREPVAFIDHDEFLHWTTANHLLEAHKLFSPNALLPISPRYPGLEIVTTALVWMSGLSVFAAAQCVLFTSRAVFMAALFFAYERFSGSSRVAACGCVVYAGCSTFLVFDTQFSYESLAVSFVAAAILADARSRASQRLLHVGFVIAPILTALALTHHMTAYFAAAFFAGLAILMLIGIAARRHLVSSLVVAAGAVILPLAWSHLMGNPGSGYLGPVLASGVTEASNLLAGAAGRRLFVSTDGYVAPLWQRLVALGSVALVCLGLAFGFFRSLALGDLRFGGPAMLFRRAGARANAGTVLLVLLTLGFPLSMVFRLTKSGWEIGNRIGPFSFVGVAFVVAVGVVACLKPGRPLVVRTTLFALAGLAILVGGIISAQGPRLLVPARFKVSSDSSSVGPMAIDAAGWTRDWLGERHLFSADRINRLLLSTYGRQDVATTLQDGYDTSDAVLAKTLGPLEKALLRRAGVDFLTVDMRLTTDLPGVGVYFDGSARDQNHRRPLDPAPLLKFAREPGIGRLFDDGAIAIYDLRALDGSR